MSTTTRTRVAEPGYRDPADIARRYEKMARANHHQRRIQVQQLLESGIAHGYVLDVGPGPGLTDLDWLELTEDTHLAGLDLSPEMLELARQNTNARDLGHRATFYHGNAEEMPFAGDTFDAVFTFNSLHEWDSPLAVFNEIHRVLKRGGRYLIGDLRRDLPLATRWFMSLYVPSRALKRSFRDSLRAGYTATDLQQMIGSTQLTGAQVVNTTFGLLISGKKG